MSAIAGIAYCDNRPVYQSTLESLLAVLAHRGPDVAGSWSAPGAGMIHRMLWTTPESLGERLPLVNCRGDLALTADARIDNRQELIDRLRLYDRPAGQVSDSELILAAYERWDTGCADYLVGDFAFAIWDSRRRRLFCARDPMGVRPLYYHATPELVAFGTEIKALLALVDVPRRINELKIAAYLVSAIDDKVATFYQDILALPPAHSLTWQAGVVQVQRYWALDPARELRLASDQEYAEAYRALLTEAVRARMRSAYPLGAMLSGGLDSSSVVGLARELIEREDAGHGPLHTFSAIFDTLPECDEREYIQAVLNLGGPGTFVPHLYPGDQVGFGESLAQALQYTDTPYAAPNLFLNWEAWSIARDHGVRVLLDGIIGDAAISYGWGYLADLARGWQLGPLVRELRGVARRHQHRTRTLLWHYLQAYALPALTPPALARLVARRHQPVEEPAELSLLNPAFARRVALADRLQAARQAAGRQPLTAREQHYHELDTHLITQALEGFVPAAAAFGIEPRMPFTDRRLLEFCLALPPEQKLSDGWTRRIVRRALPGTLPELVRRRLNKGNLGPNFIRAFAETAPQLAELAGDTSSPLAEYVNLEALKPACEQLVTQPDQADDRVGTLLASLLLHAWLRREQEHNRPALQKALAPTAA